MIFEIICNNNIVTKICNILQYFSIFLHLINEPLMRLQYHITKFLFPMLEILLLN